MADLVDLSPPRKIKRYRELFNPLEELEDKELYRRYRFTADWIHEMNDFFGADMNTSNAATNRGRPIPTEIQIMVAVRYLASNSFQIDVGDTFGIAQPTVSLILSRFLDVFTPKTGLFVKFPPQEGLQSNMQEVS
ncbi:MAG: hypothetical protein GY820_18030 [Gammaproteobacteria bacterium]|nr:hypothetical protein [Gammaproteobacteria bacterium]